MSTATGLAILGAVLLSDASAANAQTQLFEVEKGDASKLLQVADDAGLVVRGTLDVGVIPAAGPGVRLMWYPKKGAFRAGRVDGGQWDDEAVGAHSVAFGENTTADGPYSTAGGGATKASGAFATALGSQSTASGLTSTAMGYGTEARGDYSTALGYTTRASGLSSTAMGVATTASGSGSVAMGTFALAEGAGSFAFGDRSTIETREVISSLANQFSARAYGGFLFSTGVNIGCFIPSGEGVLNCTSSRLAKEGFEEVNGEVVLAKLASIPIQRWRYRGTRTVHLGPTAEDFHAAFGIGEGSTKIATADANGIALRAVQALERRTAELRNENTALRRRLEVLEAALAVGGSAP